jgi:hypothetical protein
METQHMNCCARRGNVCFYCCNNNCRITMETPQTHCYAAGTVTLLWKCYKVHRSCYHGKPNMPQYKIEMKMGPYVCIFKMRVQVSALICKPIHPLCGSQRALQLYGFSPIQFQCLIAHVHTHMLCHSTHLRVSSFTRKGLKWTALPDSALRTFFILSQSGHKYIGRTQSCYLNLRRESTSEKLLTSRN